MKATTIIPIVMTTVVDPVSAGIVASLARPGVTLPASRRCGRRDFGQAFELLKENCRTLASCILFNPDVAVNRSRLTSMAEPARVLGLTLVPVEARGLNALEQAFAIMVKERAQAFVVQEIV